MQRAQRRDPTAVADWPILDFRMASVRRTALVITALTAVNVTILLLAGYGSLHYMESPSFCGQTCHTPMRPQHTAWQNTTHSRVDCVALPYRRRRPGLRSLQAGRCAPARTCHQRQVPTPDSCVAGRTEAGARGLRPLPRPAHERRRDAVGVARVRGRRSQHRNDDGDADARRWAGPADLVRPRDPLSCRSRGEDRIRGDRRRRGRRSRTSR